MSCERIQDRLSEHLDGSLPPEVRAEIEEHLRSCVPCRGLARDLEDLGRRVREWNPEAKPDRDLWPLIADRLEPASPSRPAAPAEGPRRRPLWGWVAAAAAALVVGVMVPVAVDRLSGGGESPEGQASRERDRQAYEVLVAAASLARAEDGTLQPRRDLENLLAEYRGRFDEETVAGLEVEVDRLQRAIGEIYLALEAQPDNRQLRMQLATRYRQESDLLQRLGRV